MRKSRRRLLATPRSNRKLVGLAVAFALGLGALAAGRAASADAPPALLAASVIVGTPAGTTAAGTTPVSVQSVPDLFLLSASGRRLRRLTRTTDWEDQPAFSPDGRWIVFRQGPVFGHNEEGHPPLDAGISIVSAAGGQVRDLSHGYEQGLQDSSPSFSPDGKQVLFSRSFAAESPKIGLWLINVDGTGLRRAVKGWSSVAAFAPSGRRFVHLGDDDDELGPRPVIVELATGRQTQIPIKGGRKGFGYATDVSFSPTGRELVLTTTTGVFTLPAAGGTLRRIAGAAYADPKYATLNALPASAAFSADGRQLAIVGRRKGGAASIALVGRDGSGLRTVTPPGGSYFDPAFKP